MKDIFLIDFDGTISFNDSTHVLANEFIPEMYEEYLNRFRLGEINIKTFINDLLSNLNIDKDTFKDTLYKKVVVDKTFKEFISKDIEFRIVSAGTKLNVTSSLENIQLVLNNEFIYANDIKFNNDNIKVEFPFTGDAEENGLDKSLIIKKYKKLGYRVIFIGDGPSDFVVMNVADIIFAKRNKSLAKRCKDKNIPFMEFDDFNDIYEQYKNNMKRKGD